MLKYIMLLTTSLGITIAQAEPARSVALTLDATVTGKSLGTDLFSARSRAQDDAVKDGLQVVQDLARDKALSQCQTFRIAIADDPIDMIEIDEVHAKAETAQMKQWQESCKAYYNLDDEDCDGTEGTRERLFASHRYWVNTTLKLYYSVLISCL